MSDNPLKPKPTQQQPDFEPEMPLTPRQAQYLGLFLLWLMIAGLWQTVETIIVLGKWLFR